MTGTPVCPHRSMQPLTLHLFCLQPAQKQNEHSSARLRLLRRYCYARLRTQTFDRNEVKTWLQSAASMRAGQVALECASASQEITCNRYQHTFLMP
jgi:hypothetical protein